MGWFRFIVEAAQRGNASQQKIEPFTELRIVKYVIPAILAAALGLGVLSGGDAEAGIYCNCPRCQQVRRQQPKQPNLFQQLMELERRKNAWLKKTFLGR